MQASELHTEKLYENFRADLEHRISSDACHKLQKIVIL